MSMFLGIFLPCEGAWFDWKYWDDEEWKPGNINVTCANGDERSDSDNDDVFLPSAGEIGSDYHHGDDSNEEDHPPCHYSCDGWPYKRCTVTMGRSRGRCQPPYESRRNKCLFSRFPKKVSTLIVCLKTK